MSNMHRIMWFDSQMKENKYPNRSDLAEQFEISIRQAQRDIDYLKDSLNAPLCYDAKRRGYYYEEKTFVIPNVYINEEQKRLLSFLTYSYENHNQSPKVKKMVEVFKRLSGDGNSEEDVPIFDLNKSITENLNLLAEAITKRQKVKLKYRDPHQGAIEQTIHPYRLFNKYRVDNIYCYCEELKDFTSLRIDRITSLYIMNEFFHVNLDNLGSAPPFFTEKSPYMAKIKFSKEPYFMNSKGLRIIEVADYIYQIHFYNIEELINQLLIIDYWEEIYSPKWLKRKVKERCMKIIKRLDKEV